MTPTSRSAAAGTSRLTSLAVSPGAAVQAHTAAPKQADAGSAPAAAVAIVRAVAMTIGHEDVTVA